MTASPNADTGTSQCLLATAAMLLMSKDLFLMDCESACQAHSLLLQLPSEVLQVTLLPCLTGRSLAALEATCRSFRALGPCGLRITEAAARDNLLRRCGNSEQYAGRWRYVGHINPPLLRCYVSMADRKQLRHPSQKG